MAPCSDRRALRSAGLAHHLELKRVFEVTSFATRYFCGYTEWRPGGLRNPNGGFWDGTAVYGADEQRIGSIQRVMIDKISGKVAYAVMSFGGFLGIGEDYYPVPWSTLKYDTNLGGYRVSLTNDQLKGAPKFSSSTDWTWNRDNDRKVYDYYSARPYWNE